MILSQLLAAETADRGKEIDGPSAEGRPLSELSRPCQLRLRQQRGQRGARIATPSLRVFGEDAHNVVPPGRGDPGTGKTCISPRRSASRPSSITASA